ncbi:MAG TPA: hypothetical protein VMH00_17110 [Candidatus Limnocylindrales bacterium]|nr:hypothetical protein [Candidatus Limnocylindrales bacterium]
MSVSSKTRSLWIAIIGVPVLFVGMAALQVRIDAQTRTEAAQEEELFVRSGSLLRNLSLGYDSLLADVYWTRAVQYYGSRIGDRNTDFGLLAPLLNIATTLDPRLVVAYRFGAIFLSEGKPIGAGRPDLAVDLVKRGIAANPGVWRLYYDLGFLYYFRLKDYKDASAAYLEGGDQPGAPIIMRLMAARVAEKGGSLETSRMILAEMYESTKDKSVRKVLMKQLRGLKAAEDEMHIDELSEQYRQRFHHNPASINDMVSAGYLPGAPVDPAGFPYVLGRDGKSHLNPDSPVELPKP